MEFRKRWANNWESVKYCSKACRTHRVQAIDIKLESAIVDLLQQQPVQGSICPSEAAQTVAGKAWQPLIESSRMAARRLVHRGVVEITQQNKKIDISTAKGLIRIRRGAHFPVRDR